MGVIGNLVIRITTNLQEFRREMQDAGKEAEETGKKVEDQAGRASRSVEGLGTQLRALLSVGAAAGAARLAAQAITSATSDTFAISRADLALGGQAEISGLGRQIQSERLRGGLTPIEQARRELLLRTLDFSASDRESTVEASLNLREEMVLGTISREQLSGFSGFLRNTIVGRALSGNPLARLGVSGINRVFGTRGTVGADILDQIGQFDTSGRTRNTLENQLETLQLGSRLRTQQAFAAGDDLAQAQFEASVRGFTEPGVFVDTTQRLIEEMRLLRASFESRRGN